VSDSSASHIRLSSLAALRDIFRSVAESRLAIALWISSSRFRLLISGTSQSFNIANLPTCHLLVLGNPRL
jgi:hypothetical protein